MRLFFKKKTNVLLLISLFQTVLNAQSVDLKDLLREADKHFKKGNYEKALPLYLEVSKNPDVVVGDEDKINYNIAFCYYNSVNEKDRSISYFKKYLENSEELFEAHYLLGKVLHYYGRFDDAISEYNLFRTNVLKDTIAPAELNESLTTIADREIERCNFGKVFVRNPRDMVIENLGEKINSVNMEYAPVISPDETKLLFTARRPEGIKKIKSEDGDYFEDIYISNVLQGSLFKTNDNTNSKAGYVPIISDFTLSQATLMNTNINSAEHEGAIQFSYGSDKLFIYKGAQVWVSELKDSVWQKMRVMSEIDGATDKNAFEPSVSISQDGTVLYLSSDRKNGYGGLDIYESRKQRDGSWSEAVNLGPAINTIYDEDAPYIDPNGVTLYFSSKGHSSMGGYDVFKSVYSEHGWGAPENMGFPINSAGEDIFFMMTPKYNRAYYSSDKLGGLGKMDIYRVTFADERTPMAEVKGMILLGDSLLPMRSKISIVDLEYNEEISQHYSDSTTGRYHLLFAHGKHYNVTVETPGFVPYKKVFSIPNQIQYYHYYQEIHHVYIKDKKGKVIGQKVTLHSATVDPFKNKEKNKFDLGTDSLKLKGIVLSSLGVGIPFINLIQTTQDSIYNYITDSTGVFAYNSKNIFAENSIKLRDKKSNLLIELYDDNSNLIEKLTNKQDSITFRKESVLNENALTITDAHEESKQQSDEKLDAIIENLQVIEAVDVKFFLSEDSIISILEEDTTLSLVFPEKASLSFYNPQDSIDNIYNLSSYEESTLAMKSRTIDSLTVSKSEKSIILENNYNQGVLKKFNNDSTSTFTFSDTLKTENSSYKTFSLRDVLLAKAKSKQDSYIECDSLKRKANIIDEKSTMLDSINDMKDTFNIKQFVALFEYDNTRISDKEKKVLDKIVDYLKRNSQVSIEIIGHTDGKGEDYYNQKLSEKRAVSVQKYFLKKGINTSRITATGKGELEPIAPNIFVDGSDNEEGRKLNRRVEFRILK